MLPNLPKITKKEGAIGISICAIIIIALVATSILAINGYNPTIHF